MVTTILHYRVKLGTADQMVRLAEVELVPALRARHGLMTHQAVLAGSQAVIFVSTYEDRSAADAALEAAAAWADRLGSVIEGPARMTMGEVKSCFDTSREPATVSEVV